MIEPAFGLTPATTWILVAAFFLAGPVLALAPLGMAPLLVAAAFLTVAIERGRGGRWLKPASQLMVLFLVFFVWCAVTLLWDLRFSHGLRKLLDLALVLAATLALYAAGSAAAPFQRRKLALALAGGIVLGLVLEGIETGFDFPLYRAVAGNSDPRLVDLLESKRAVDALPLLVWPAAFAIARLGKTWLAIVLVVVFTAACFKWTASSAALGMAASLVVLGLAFLSVRWTRSMLVTATILAFLLIIPGSILAYDHGGTTAPFLKHSAQHRIEIWHFAAEKARARPVLGYGFNASRDVPNGNAVSAFLEPGKPIIPLHPHDGFLQIWLELGVVGVALTLLVLTAGLRATARWPRGSSRFVLAGYAAGMVIAGLAFGIWQTWWMATLAFSATAFHALGQGPDYA